METINSHGKTVQKVFARFEINPEDLGPLVSYGFGGNNFPEEPGNARYQSYRILTNTEVRLTGSVSPSVPVVEYFWDFGDGSTGYGPEITHTYITASPQTQIVLTATLVDGRKVRSHQVINLGPGFRAVLNAYPASGS